MNRCVRCDKAVLNRTDEEYRRWHWLCDDCHSGKYEREVTWEIRVGIGRRRVAFIHDKRGWHIEREEWRP